MAEVGDLVWPQDPVANGLLITVLLEACEIAAGALHEDLMPTIANAIEDRIDETVRSNEKNSAGIEGAEIARAALHRIFRR